MEVIGITSFGQGCGMKDVPGGYTRVNRYVRWMMHKITDITPKVTVIWIVEQCPKRLKLAFYGRNIQLLDIYSCYLMHFGYKSKVVFHFLVRIWQEITKKVMNIFGHFLGPFYGHKKHEKLFKS